MVHFNNSEKLMKLMNLTMPHKATESVDKMLSKTPSSATQSRKAKASMQLYLPPAARQGKQQPENSNKTQKKPTQNYYRPAGQKSETTGLKAAPLQPAGLKTSSGQCQGGQTKGFNSHHQQQNSTRGRKSHGRNSRPHTQSVNRESGGVPVEGDRTGHTEDIMKSYYEGHQDSRWQQQNEQIQSLAETVDKLSNLNINNVPFSPSEGGCNGRPTNNRKARPDQVLYVPKHRRYNSNNINEYPNDQLVHLKCSSLAEKYQNHNTAISPAPSITSLVSEFIRQQRFEHERKTLRDRANFRTSVYQEDKGQFTEHDYRSPGKKYGVLGNKSSSSQSINCKENIHSDAGDMNKKRRRRNNKGASRSTETSCDVPLKGAIFYQSSYLNNYSSCPFTPSEVSHNPQYPNEPSNQYNSSRVSDSRQDASQYDSAAPPSTSQKPPTGRPSPTNELKPQPSNIYPNTNLTSDLIHSNPSVEIIKETTSDWEVVDSSNQNKESIDIGNTTSLLNTVYINDTKSEEREVNYLPKSWAEESEVNYLPKSSAEESEENYLPKSWAEESEENYLPKSWAEASEEEEYNDTPTIVDTELSYDSKEFYSSVSCSYSNRPAHQDYSQYQSTNAPDYYQLRRQSPDSGNCSPPGSSSPPSSLAHVLELYDFPTNFKTRDLVTVYQPLQAAGPVFIKWVNDTHALAVFMSASIALEALSLPTSLIRSRPLSEASQAAKTKAARIDDALLPAKPRPQTSMLLARRLLTGALGVRVSVSREEREREAQAIRDAKNQKKRIAQQKRDVWEGCA